MEKLLELLVVCDCFGWCCRVQVRMGLARCRKVSHTTQRRLVWTSQIMRSCSRFPHIYICHRVLPQPISFCRLLSIISMHIHPSASGCPTGYQLLPRFAVYLGLPRGTQAALSTPLRIGMDDLKFHRTSGLNTRESIAQVL